jgi:hypothetical protein
MEKSAFHAVSLFQFQFEILSFLSLFDLKSRVLEKCYVICVGKKFRVYVTTKSKGLFFDFSSVERSFRFNPNLDCYKKCIGVRSKVFNFRFFLNFAKHETIRKPRLFRENFACFAKQK